MCFSLLRQNNYFIFELFVFIRLTALYIPMVAKNLLIQDKICLLSYNQSAQFCQDIHKEFNTTEEQHMKNVVLSEAAMFTNYEQIIESAAMVLWSLFVGSFLDKYAGGTILIMALNIFSDFFSTVIYLCGIGLYDSSANYLLISSISIWFTGGMMSFMTTTLRYISMRTTDETRLVKFVVLQIIFVIGVASSVFFGGRLLVNTSSGPRLRTYAYNFLLTLGLDVSLVILLVILYFQEKRCSSNSFNFEQINDAYSNVTMGKYNPFGESFESNIQKIECSTQVPNSKLPANKGFLKTLFDLDNVKQTITSLTKPRDHQVRLQIYLLFTALFAQVLVTNGLKNILLQFAQKVYHWSATTYTSIAAIQQIAQMILSGVFSVIFMKCMKLQDTTLVVIAQVSTLLSDFVKGIILNPIAFFISLPLGSLSSLGDISIKTKLSKIVPEDEVGKMFSLTSTIEALVPIVASLVYSNIFSLSIGTYPGLIYLCSCVLIIFAIVIMIIERFHCPVQSLKEYEKSLETKGHVNA